MYICIYIYIMRNNLYIIAQSLSGMWPKTFSEFFTKKKHFGIAWDSRISKPHGDGSKIRFLMRMQLFWVKNFPGQNWFRRRREDMVSRYMWCPVNDWKGMKRLKGYSIQRFPILSDFTTPKYDFSRKGTGNLLILALGRHPIANTARQDVPREFPKAGNGPLLHHWDDHSSGVVWICQDILLNI